MIGNTRTAALVGKHGSIDWLCVPRFDSPACFAALLGDVENGRWLIAPQGEVRAVSRRYHDRSLILETRFETASGSVAVVDFMPRPSGETRADLVRIVRGLSGRVTMRLEFILRFDYGSIVPWVRRREDGLSAVAGPDAVRLYTALPLDNHNFRTEAAFDVEAGAEVCFALCCFPSHQSEPPCADIRRALEETETWWRGWSEHCSLTGPWQEAGLRSLITLKGLTHAASGGIVAAPTTSLPEHPGGTRNWDYRFCWIRDATFTLYALTSSGLTEEAQAWRDWLLRAVAGKPSQVQIMYGVTGQRRLPELTLPWLPGYESSRPVRIGNEAHRQRQLDVYGEIMDAFHQNRIHGLTPSDDAWRVETVLMEALEETWRLADNGIWEIRGPRRHFTHSKMMAWVAADRAVKAIERFGIDGPLARWRRLRDAIREDVLGHGFDKSRNAFVQYYGGRELDASLLMMPLVGFLPADDPRIVGTVEAIRRELTFDGLVLRYRSESTVDGLPPGEGAFLACSFWLADVLAMQGRREEAVALFESLLALRNDVGLLAEEYDPRARRQLGNFPQAFSHVALVNTMHNLTTRQGPAEERAGG